MNWAEITHFHPDEFRCACCLELNMEESFVRKLNAMRQRLAFPFIVRSGYRCPAHNERVSSTGRDGPHTTGRAVDLAMSGAQVYELLQYAFAFGITGIGIKGLGPHSKRFVHLDDLEAPYPRPTVWTYAP